MTRKILLLVFAFFLSGATLTRSDIFRENFTDDPVGKFPKPFKTYPFQRGDAIQCYWVAEENGARFLRAEDNDGLSVQIFRELNWDLKKTPSFSWKWRARTLPKGAGEAESGTNDSACGIYVVFGRYSGRAIKYVWSSSLKPGTVINKGNDGKLFIVVLQSGPEKLGQWITEKVDVVADYKRLFGKDPDKNPSGFGLLTDGNATHTPAACDYGDFVVAPANP